MDPPNANPSSNRLLEEPEPYSPSRLSELPHFPEKGEAFRWEQLLSKTWKDAVADFKSTEWGFCLRWLLFFCWTNWLIISLSFVPILVMNPRGGNPFWVPNPSACLPDGGFTIYNHSFDLWSISGFFQVTLGFGNLTFTQAKVVDVIWDIGVGRIGQAIVAWFSWKAFSAYIRNAMATTPVTYDTFWTIFMRDEASIVSATTLTRDFSKRRGLESKVAMTFIIATMAFVLALPTIASAMTGYAARSLPFVADKEGNLIAFASFKPVAYIIHDGWKVDLEGDYHVVYYVHAFRGYGDFLVDPGENLGISLYYKSCSSVGPGAEFESCKIIWETSEYARKYGLNGLNAEGKINDVESTWMNKTIRAPTLNISAVYVQAQRTYYADQLFGWDLTDPRTQRQYSNASNLEYFGPSNTTYSTSYMMDKGTCQPGLTYQWGFSFLQLYISLLLLLTWSMGTGLMWAKARIALARTKEVTVPAKYRAAFELIATMRKEFQDISEDPATLTDEQIEYHVKNHLNGGCIESHDGGLGGGDGLAKGLRGWMKREKWWLVALIPLIAFVDGAWYLPYGLDSYQYLYWLALSLVVALYLALAVGSTTGSRLFIALCGLVVAIVVASSTWAVSPAAKRERGGFYSDY